MGSLAGSLGLDPVLGELGLACTQYHEDSGVWLLLVRTNFDLFLLEEPYLAMGLLVNTTSCEYILRVLGSTRERGFYSSPVELVEVVAARFRGTVACVGNPSLREEEGAVRVEQPFLHTVHSSCTGYYTPAGGEEVPQGRGRCHHCSQPGPASRVGKAKVLPGPRPEETSGEDVKILAATAEGPGGPIKRKRGRPRKIVEDPNKLRKTLSEKTKSKIAENNRKFSICKLCSKQCRGFRGLVDHMHRDHSDHQPWECAHCPVKTAFVKTLYRHLKKVHGVTDCPCPRCGKTYSRAQSMLFHMSRHEENEMDFFQCGQCQSRFKKKEKLEQHISKKHSGGFECDICDRKFSEQTSLKEHKRVHTRERPHQCTECGATFSFQSTFISHRKMHFREQGLTEEEAKVKLYYFCETCGKSYANKAGLRLHKLHVHDKYSEEVPCHVCGISFRTRELLKQHHEREHSIEPKFVCEECGQRFGNSYHLKRHMTSHSTDGFPCSLCSRVFKRKDGLDTHFSTAHRDQGKPSLAPGGLPTSLLLPGEAPLPSPPGHQLPHVDDLLAPEGRHLPPPDGHLAPPGAHLPPEDTDLALQELQELLGPQSPQLSHLSVRDGFNSAVNSILNRELGGGADWGDPAMFDLSTLEPGDPQAWQPTLSTSPAPHLHLLTAPPPAPAPAPDPLPALPDTQVAQVQRMSVIRLHTSKCEQL